MNVKLRNEIGGLAIAQKYASSSSKDAHYWHLIAMGKILFNKVAFTPPASAIQWREISQSKAEIPITMMTNKAPLNVE